MQRLTSGSLGRWFQLMVPAKWPASGKMLAQWQCAHHDDVHRRRGLSCRWTSESSAVSTHSRISGVSGIWSGTAKQRRWKQWRGEMGWGGGGCGPDGCPVCLIPPGSWFRTDLFASAPYQYKVGLGSRGAGVARLGPTPGMPDVRCGAALRKCGGPTATYPNREPRRLSPVVRSTSSG
jgi:hypothetical protein